MKQIATALLKAQSEMSNPKKGATNPFFKSKYADLNAIREAVIPTLNDNGISVLQPIVHVDGKNFVKTILLHESGESIDSLTEIIYNKQNDAQAQGSGISYSRRYALQSFVCVGADDDDGQKAVQIPSTPKLNDKQFDKLINGTKEEIEKYLKLIEEKKIEVTQVQHLDLKNKLKELITNK